MKKKKLILLIFTVIFLIVIGWWLVIILFATNTANYLFLTGRFLPASAENFYQEGYSNWMGDGDQEFSFNIDNSDIRKLLDNGIWDTNFIPTTEEVQCLDVTNKNEPLNQFFGPNNNIKIYKSPSVYVVTKLRGPLPDHPCTNYTHFFLDTENQRVIIVKYDS